MPSLSPIERTRPRDNRVSRKPIEIARRNLRHKIIPRLQRLPRRLLLIDRRRRRNAQRVIRRQNARVVRESRGRGNLQPQSRRELVRYIFEYNSATARRDKRFASAAVQQTQLDRHFVVIRLRPQHAASGNESATRNRCPRRAVVRRPSVCVEADAVRRESYPRRRLYRRRIAHAQNPSQSARQINPPATAGCDRPTTENRRCRPILSKRTMRCRRRNWTQSKFAQPSHRRHSKPQRRRLCPSSQ